VNSPETLSYTQFIMPSAVFSDQEIITFLHFVRETGTFKAIDGRVQRNIEVFDRLAALTNGQGQQDGSQSKILESS
jgi:hypothetical protein